MGSLEIPFGDESAQPVQVDQMGEFHPISKGAAGSDDGISEAQSANLHAEVNAIRRDSHWSQRIARSAPPP